MYMTETLNVGKERSPYKLLKSDESQFKNYSFQF